MSESIAKQNNERREKYPFQENIFKVKILELTFSLEDKLEKLRSTKE